MDNRLDGYLIAVVIAFLFWFLLLRPMNKKYHKAKLELLQKQIQEREEKLLKNNTDEKI